jgi:hypothetical protein
MPTQPEQPVSALAAEIWSVHGLIDLILKPSPAQTHSKATQTGIEASENDLQIVWFSAALLKSCARRAGNAELQKVLLDQILEFFGSAAAECHHSYHFKVLSFLPGSCWG